MQSNSPPVSIIYATMHALPGLMRHGQLPVTMHFYPNLAFSLESNSISIWSTHIGCVFLSFEKEFTIRKVFATVHAERSNIETSGAKKKQISYLADIDMTDSKRQHIHLTWYFFLSIHTIPHESTRMDVYLMHTRIKSIHFWGLCSHLKYSPFGNTHQIPLFCFS